VSLRDTIMFLIIRWCCWLSLRSQTPTHARTHALTHTHHNYYLHTHPHTYTLLCAECVKQQN